MPGDAHHLHHSSAGDERAAPDVHAPGVSASAAMAGGAASSAGPSAAVRSRADQLLSLVYDELRALAAASLRDERPGHTLQTTALAHEAYLRLVDQRAVDFNSRTQVMALAGQAIRRILVDHARARHAAKRGGGGGANGGEAWSRIELDDLAMLTDGRAIDILALDEAMAALEAESEQSARIVEMRFFGGLSEAEIAQTLGVSTRSVERGWAFAKRWLYKRMTEERASDGA
jgi:RNA polymerase sigma-70 factor (ECF subfamily)